MLATASLATAAEGTRSGWLGAATETSRSASLATASLATASLWLAAACVFPATVGLASASRSWDACFGLTGALALSKPSGVLIGLSGE